LKKLSYVLKFDFLERYKKLLQFYEKYELNDEIKWVKTMIKKIENK
jgi:hypothetical protein